MNIEEILQWTDEQVFNETGKHLDSLQKAILEGTWQGQKYPEIAQNTKRSHDHVKQAARELWKILSDVLEEDIKQSNARSIIENKAVSGIYSYGEHSRIFNNKNVRKSYINFNFCSKEKLFSENPQQRSPVDSNNQQTEFPIINLNEAPELNEFFDRTTELTTLKQWITEEHTHLITIYGLSGIGKSAIARQLIEEIKTEFDYIIWKSLDNKITLTNLQTQLRQFIDHPLEERSPETPQPNIIDYLRAYRCLIILDDLQNLFATGELAGQYLPEYEDYSKFFQQVAKNCHQSCLILLSLEKPRENTNLKAEKRSIQTLHLQGLSPNASQAILENKGLTDQEYWAELINLYQHHPTWLNIITTSIIKLFNGSVSLFLADEPTEIYLGNIETILARQLQRLSSVETSIIIWLAQQKNPVDISQRPTDINLSKSEFRDAVESFMRRGLLEKIEAKENNIGRSLFSLNPICQQYINNQNL